MLIFLKETRPFLTSAEATSKPQCAFERQIQSPSEPYYPHRDPNVSFTSPEAKSP